MGSAKFEGSEGKSTNQFVQHELISSGLKLKVRIELIKILDSPLKNRYIHLGKSI